MDLQDLLLVDLRQLLLGAVMLLVELGAGVVQDGAKLVDLLRL